MLRFFRQNWSFAVVLCILIFLPGTAINAQDFFEGWEHLFQQRESYVIYKTYSKIEIDGKANEDSWKQVAWTSDFRDIEGGNKKEPQYRTRVKMLWDDENLYLFAEMAEPHIWAYYDTHDQIVYHENDFEVFIDPNQDTHEYFEIEINAQNTVFDLFMTKPYRNGGIPLITWDVKNMENAVFIDGTLNEPADTDKKWTIEMAIPFASLRLGVRTRLPEEGTIWKLNFSRVQWQTDIEEGKYKRKRDEQTGRLLPEDNWVWSPVGVINMHYPEKWGLVYFSENDPNINKVTFELPEEERLADYLWLLYYKQRKYRSENKMYASGLQELNFPENPEPGINVSMQSTDVQFSASLETNSWHISINNEGKIHKSKRK